MRERKRWIYPFGSIDSAGVSKRFKANLGPSIYTFIDTRTSAHSKRDRELTRARTHTRIRIGRIVNFVNFITIDCSYFASI